MSKHIVEQEHKQFVFGWDQPLSSFYLKIYDLALAEDEQIVEWFGATKDTIMYEVEDLVRVAMRNGLDIPYRTQVELYAEKDDGR